VHSARDLIAGGAHLVERLPLRVWQLPVDVVLAGDNWALVSAAHGDDDVGSLSQVACEQAWPAVCEVDPDLAHNFDDLGVYALGRFGPGRSRRVPSSGVALEQRQAHL
jgi:hypothetical protein